MFAELLTLASGSSESNSYAKCRKKLPGNLAYSSNKDELVVVHYNSNFTREGVSSILKILRPTPLYIHA